MLTKCPECDLPVSDKAITCPHCGYPLVSPPAKTTKNKRKNKRRSLPNGFGQISEIKGYNLRKPFRAMVTVGKRPDGSCIVKPLKPEAFFETYNDAYLALVEYNRNPYDLDDDITMSELYEKWMNDSLKDASDAYKRTVTSCWAYCSSIYNIRVKDVRARHIKGCMENGIRVETRGKNKGKEIRPTAGTKSRMKSIFNLMLDYAVEYELADRNYARTFEISDNVIKEIEANKKKHINLTDDEMQILWDNVNKVKYVDWILVQCYMGWRPQELATLRLDEVNLEKWYMQAGMKTEAGKQRIVPIHPKIKGLVVQNYQFAESIGSEYLFNDKGQTHSGSWAVTYDKYKSRFDKVVDQLGLNPDHRPHDPRVTFTTNCKKAGVDEYALKEMVGHSIKDITESAYTIRDLEWLRKDLEKLP